ncbi:uncharacterized protein STEHIDRAFT_146275 [Stereum hirsutum FP-91666 SS1]|uniref:uncharacterized protein n=1 Tax=Stereum hirsutum (strain FP-91666) TaxID=721885 RepID=UPI00044100A2|nr:uncharacterized protein STEHIDRAFT_146275 [Stereum hirsutum FP-91666 SS1]EIM88209.1 hypothetical protein STEHIDRAFT_146275 [Stereum hirsutum FP-91666 SS1]
MTTESREIGTLIAVILKARNLPNKRHIGKQAPYCTVVHNGETRRTKAIKRGGQHPEWDEEIRFNIYEDDEDEVARAAIAVGLEPPAPPPKNGKGPKKIKGGKNLALACYADDPREPELIGEALVDLTEVLTKGETDEWFTLLHKDKYCGEVYLELTFWSNERPPEKKAATKQHKLSKQYGGPGSFVPLADSPYDADGRPMSVSDSQLSIASRDSVPASLRPSGLSSKIDLYVPPYESTIRARSQQRESSVEGIANDFGELGIHPPGHRRESFPPIHHAYGRSTSSSGSYMTSSVSSSHAYPASEHSSWTDTGPPYTDDRPLTPQPPAPHRYHSDSVSSSRSYPAPSNYQPPYESNQALAPSYSYQSPVRHSRYSIPASSSGFVSMPSASSSSSFSSLPFPSFASEPSGLAPPPAHTPIPPSGYQAPYPPPTPTPANYAPMPSHTPVPSSYMTAPPTAAYGQYNGYAPPPPSSAPPGHYPPPPSTSPLPPPPQSAPPQSYQGYPPDGYQSQEPQPTNPPMSNIPPSSSSMSTSTSSRPLPQPQGYAHNGLPAPPPPVAPQNYGYTQPPGSHYVPPPPGPPSQQPNYGQLTQQSQSNTPRDPLPTPPGPPGPLQPGSYSPPQQGGSTLPPPHVYNNVPPPPPLPHNSSSSSIPSQGYHQQQLTNNAPTPSPSGPLKVPPPPPIPTQNSGHTHQRVVSHRSSLPLPQPPAGSQIQQPIYQPIPPPPMPPALPVSHSQSLPQVPTQSSITPSHSGYSFNPGPPPRPPMLNGVPPPPPPQPQSPWVTQPQAYYQH